MEAELGCNPSFVWRSLLEARELVGAGTVWQVGDGQSIEVSDHRWLNNPPQFRPGIDTNLKVADLIDQQTRQWNKPLLQATFQQSTMNDILRIKIAYWVALRLNQPENAEHSTAREDKKFWNKMWKLHLPPKVRNFIWRACSDILPTSTNLCRRRIPVASTCTICQQQEETVAHVLWECPLARNVWGMVKGQLQKCNSETPNFYILAQQMEEKLPKKDLELWAMVS
uniref:Reverse transcriptase zinc-binding domain-containing protein n=1 Tax=Quercus lobata TaxID=97700 RepID=A0A7N2LID0_QUELO